MKDDDEKSQKHGCLGIIIFIVIIVLIFRGNGKGNEKDTMDETKEYPVTITMEYQKIVTTSNTPMHLYIDGVDLNRQEAGTTEEYSVDLVEGVHEMYMKNDGIYKTEVLKFTVDENNTNFEFGAKTRLTFGVKIWAK